MSRYYQKQLTDFLVRITRSDENKTVHWGYYDAVVLAPTETAFDADTGKMVEVPSAIVPVHMWKISKQIKSDIPDWSRYEVFNCALSYLKNKTEIVHDKVANVKKGDIIQYQLNDGRKLTEEVEIVFPNLPYPTTTKLLLKALKSQESVSMAKFYSCVIDDKNSSYENYVTDDRSDLIKTGDFQNVVDVSDE